MRYIWESAGWPNFTFNREEVEIALRTVRFEKLVTDHIFSIITPEMKQSLEAKAVTEDIVSSLSIEGETISMDSVFDSVSRHLDVLYKGKARDDAYASSVFSIVSDAVGNMAAMTDERLFEWQRKLFLHKAGPKPKSLGAYRTGREYVVHGKGKEQEAVCEAVPPESVGKEMEKLLSFVNGDSLLSPYVHAAIVSLWFVLIHPFEDGNGRISRSLSDYVIARGEGAGFRTFSISSAILKQRKEYYLEIQKVASSPDLDITEWILWFLSVIKNSLVSSQEQVKRTLAVTGFMKSLPPEEYNSRELSMLYRLSEGTFLGKVTTDKWMRMTKCSNTVAFRDIQHLVNQGFLVPSGEGGRSTGYYFNDSFLLAPHPMARET